MQEKFTNNFFVSLGREEGRKREEAGHNESVWNFSKELVKL